MPRRLLHAMALVAVAVALSGCSQVFTGRTVPTLDVGENYVQDIRPNAFVLGPGASLITWYDLSTAQGEAIYFVTDAGDLRLRTPNATTYASSSSGFYFASGDDGLFTSSASSLTPQAISVTTSCVGPCIIIDEQQAAEIEDGFVRITNPFSTELEVQLWVFSKGFDDSFDAGNDSAATATLLPTGFSSAALETISDTDVFEVSAFGDVTVYAPTVAADAFASDILSIEAEILDVNGNPQNPSALIGGENPVTIAPGESYTFQDLFDGEYVRIHALDNRAAAAEYSRYQIELQATP